MFTQRAEALPPKKRALRQRRLLVVDIENCVGGAVLTTGAARWAREVLERAVGCSTDQVVVGVSHVGLISTFDAWPSARLVVASGPDGADRVLLEVLQHEGVAHRFDEVVIASGDGIFVEAVAELAAMGVRVTVIGHRGHVAARLRAAATDTKYIGRAQGQTGDAA